MKQQQRGYTEPFSLIEQEDRRSTAKKLALLVVLLVMIVVCMITAQSLGQLPPAYNGGVDVATLQEDPSAYSLDEADGAAYVIVAKNLEETNAKNVCFSVVFNFRGYDTMGESFILIAALAGSLCILRDPAEEKSKGKAGAKK